MQACWDDDCGRDEIGSTDLSRPAFAFTARMGSFELTGKGQTWTRVRARGVVYTALAPGPGVEPFGAPSGRVASVLSARSYYVLKNVTF